MSPDDLLEIISDLIPEHETVRLGTVAAVFSSGTEATVRLDGETTAGSKRRKCVGYTAVVGDRVALLRAGHSWVIVGKVGSAGPPVLPQLGRFIKRGRTSVQSIANNTDTDVLFNTTLESHGSSFWSLPGSGKLRIQETGTYLLHASCYWSGTNAGWRRIQLYAPDLRAMQTFEVATTIAVAGHCATTERVAAGTDVFCQVRHTAGSALDLHPFQVTFLSATKLD